MPYEEDWVEPTLFLEHAGTFVYHTYVDDDADQPNDFWYDTDPEGGENTEFDIRLLSTIGTAGGDHKKAIQLAIDKGEIPKVKNTRHFIVMWEMDFEATDARDAARQALEVQRDPESIATVFVVTDRHGSQASVDLQEIDSNRENK
jgi:desulfoferrodoxin (superoxide reductase-like protein)